MGIYIYTLRAKTANIVHNDKVIVANLLAYIGKDSFNRYASLRGALTRAENFWSDREPPKYFVVGDKFENGAELRTDWKDGQGWCYDTPDFAGTHLGYLKKSGRKWTVVSDYRECEVN